MRVLALISSIAAVCALDARQPTFRSSRDVLTVTAAVRGPNGGALTDLLPADFSVRVDGQLRAVVAVRLFRAAADAEASPGSTPHFSRTVTAPPGRVVDLVVDRLSTAARSPQPLIDAATALLQSLSPFDAAGLHLIPGAAAEGLPPTLDRTAIDAAVRGLTGAAFASPDPWKYPLSWDQARVFEGPPPAKESIQWTAWQNVFDAICGKDVADRECWGGVVGQAKSMLGVAQLHARLFVTALNGSLDRLAPLRGPRQIIAVTQGIPIDDDFAQQYREVAERARRAGVSIYVSHVTGGWFVDGAGRTFDRMFNGREYANVLARVTAVTGGSFAAAPQAAADAANIYELGVESRASDGDGTEHRVEIAVARTGAVVRAASTLIVRPGQTVAAIDRALTQPTNVSELPLDVATYLTHSPDPGQVRVLIAARTPGEIVPADWGVAIMEGSRPVTGRTVHVDAGTPAPWQATISIDVPPGRYRLRAAAVTGDGRFGVLDLAMRAGLRAGDDASLSDVVVGAVAGGQLQPREVLGQYDRAAAMIELSSPHALDGTTGELTVTPWEGATPAAHAILTLRPRQDDTSVVVGEAPLDLSTVAPGTYTVTATLTRGGTPIGRVSRLVDVVAGAPVGPLASRPAPAISKRTPVLKPDPAATTLMQRVGEYVARYGDAASVLLATEHYRQEATQKSQVGLDRGTELSHGILTGGTPVSSAKTARTLTSEMALVRNASAVGGWLGFRSVTGVDGKSVGDSARLKALFGAAVPDVEAARRISEESARLNVGPITRTFNVPTSALFFFTPANLSRFAFHHDGGERIDGVDTWRIAFQEVAAPTLIMTVAGRDVPSAGTLWVNPADGSVLRTRLSVLDYAGTSSVALVEVTYRREPSVDLLVPASMREWYNVGLASVAAEATYSDYKRFQTSIRIK